MRMILPRGEFPDLRSAHTTLTGPPVPRRAGHAHFWQRALSRRGFLASSAGVTAAIAGVNLWMPAVARAHERDDPDKRTRAMPRPIPGGLMLGGTLFHVFLPSVDHNAEPSTITDFDGTIGFADITGAGTAEDTRSGHKHRLLFDVDVRFMKGRFVATDGHVHRGAFAFI